MKLFDALSTATTTPEAIDEIVSRAARFRDEIDAPPDLAVLFVTSHHHATYGEIGKRVIDATGVRHLVGCSAESVIASGREIERSAAIALWMAHLPGARIESFHLTHATDGDTIGFSGLPGDLLSEAQRPLGLLLGDPFSFPADEFLRAVAEAHPGLPLVGGLASGAMQPRQNVLYRDGEVHDEGAVGVILDGGPAFETVVSQGCAPIGHRYVVTGARANLITELGGQPVREAVQELFESLEPAERQRFEQGPHIGIALDEHREDFRRGDFLVRNVLGWDESGGLAVNDLVRRGRTVQFQVRDAAGADEDLRSLLAEVQEDPVAGGLLFSCNGRGTRLFEDANHDVNVVREPFGDIPLAGFFAGGEIGPVGDRNFLHGFTASVLLFRESQGAEVAKRSP